MTRRLVLATRNEHKVHELRQILADAGRRARAGGRRRRRRRGRARRRRDRGDLPRQRAAQGRRAGARPPGCPPWPTTPGWRSTCSAARPASSRPAGRGRRPGRMPLAPTVTAPTSTCCWSRSVTCPTSTARAAFVCAAVVALPDGRVEGVEGRVDRHARAGAARHERIRLRPGVRARRRQPHPRRVHRPREERDLAPGQRLPRARAGAARAAGLTRRSAAPDPAGVPDATVARHTGGCAQVAELADAPGLGPGSFGCAGSSPALRTGACPAPRDQRT